MRNTPDRKKGHIFTAISCEAIRRCIEKRRNGKVEFAESVVVMNHCFDCRECLKLYDEVLNEVISKFPKEDMGAWEDYQKSMR